MINKNQLCLHIEHCNLTEDKQIFYLFIKAKYLISIGSFCALTASLLGSLFPMPRIIYAMSSDGLLFHFLAHIFPPTGTPLIATIIAGVFASVLALIVSLRDLIGKIEFMYIQNR